MSSIRDIRVKIKSIENIQQITKAMKMVAAARLKKAQLRLESTRPYAQKIAEVALDLAQLTSWSYNVLLRPHQRVRRSLVLVFTGDRGLAGGFHQKVADGSIQFARKLEAQAEVATYLLGWKGWQRFQSRRIPVYQRFKGSMVGVPFPIIQGLAQELIELYRSEEFDQIYLYYARFYSAMNQRTRAFKLLPIDPALIKQKPSRGLFLFEPERREILDSILPRYIESELYRAFLETEVSELGARMTAMSSATDNAGELIDHYRLKYNKLRQSQITTEISEIVGGAEAQKG